MVSFRLLISLVQFFFHRLHLGSRFRAWNVADALEANGFTETIAHSHSDHPAHTNTTSLIRGLKQLFRLFEEIDASEFDIKEDPNTPLVKLNKFDLDPKTGEPKLSKSGAKIKHAVQYDQTLPHVIEMTKVLRAYNDLTSWKVHSAILALRMN